LRLANNANTRAGDAGLAPPLVRTTR